MENLLIYIVIFLGIISTAISIIVLKKLSQSSNVDLISKQQNLFDEMEKKNVENSTRSQELFKTLNDSQITLMKTHNDHIVETVTYMTNTNEKNLTAISQNIQELTNAIKLQLKELVQTTNNNLERLQQNNEKKLDEMRVVVDEKLNATLQDRLNKSFAIVSEQLQAVTKGLGEMQSLAVGVGDLKRVITNVKTRGTFGEVQLGNLLEQMLASNQFESQVNTNSENNDRVDYVIHLPGKDDKDVLLPVDAKFPIEDYIRLQDAYDTCDQTQIEKAQKALETRVKDEAKKIKTKYIAVPKTTDFAILYLATEGLYSEIIKNTTLIEKLQQEYHILICGPTTLSALLNSLQMGFKTLAIEKRSAEIWNMLSVFKKEFSTYVELLEKTQKKLNEASSTIEDASKKSLKISKQLSKVEGIGEDGGNLID